jgi:hypothetical protein|tara:strand:- start:1014 stop:1598 length:585 start_codon:yes stop_codon:yes gene_type:complete
MSMDRGVFGEFFFFDRPEFRPNLSPREMFLEGSFGGTYWKPIFSSVTGENLACQHLEFAEWWGGIPDENLVSEKYAKKRNRYGVRSGTDLAMWESKGWIREQDPYGWVQWYCRFFSGRRSPDDDRQIKRWLAFAGPKGRFRNQLINKVISKDSQHDDEEISPVIRQSLHHWAYRLTIEDFEAGSIERWKKHVIG